MRRRDILTFGALIGVIGLVGGCAAAHALPGGGRDTTVYIGTHTGGEGQGIFAARLDEATGKLTALGSVAGIERPTWLARDPQRPVLYSVSETGNDGKSHGSVYSLAIDPRSGKLSVLSKVDSGGGGATYLDYSSRLSAVFVANFGGGQVAAIPVAADGTLQGVTSVQTDYGSGPNPRQKGPHAHAVVVDPSAHFLLAPDLGADRVFVYRIDRATKALTRNDPPFLQMPAGSGPRHLVFSHDGRFAFLDTELSGEIYTFRWDPATGRLTPLSHIALDPPGYDGPRSAAEVALSADGRFLYASNRGENLLQVYAVDRSNGKLSEIQRLPCGGDFPWSFGIDPEGRWLIVTNETSSDLAVFAIDRTTGRLTATGNKLAVPKPVALAFSK